MESMSLPPIPLFDGTTKFSKWIEDFNAHCSARKWDTEARCGYISLFLSGNAAIAYKRLSTEDKASYPAICKALCAILDPSTPLLIQQCESIAIARRSDESIEHYAYRVSAALDAAYPDSPPALLEKFVVSHV